MNGLKHIFLLLIGFLLMISCSSNEDVDIDSENLLIGYWASAAYENEEVTFTRVAALPDNDYALSFAKNGNFLERTSGFCGTPPLHYFSVEGTWEAKNSSIIVENPHYFPTQINWRIISLTTEKLTLKRELSEQEKEHRALMELFNELSEMSISTACINEADWDFVGYGAKACGGFQGYIAYHKSINTTLFLERVNAYTEAEDSFNKKWNIISDCAITPVPIAIKCSNNFPILVY